MTASVYACYDASGVLLYVGGTKNVRTRMRQHRKMSHWSEMVSRVMTRGYSGRPRALEVEARAISLLKPVHNTSGAKGKTQSRYIWSIADAIEFSEVWYGGHSAGFTAHRYKEITGKRFDAKAVNNCNYTFGPRDGSRKARFNLLVEEAQENG